ncbi:hypothetical protein TNCV_2441821 [Trichonephila clavipes]|nr:hypothetical protein TNCV_2441821 [Trichonephila clavipes]
MFDPSSFADPTPLAQADASRDVHPRGGTSQDYFKISSQLYLSGAMVNAKCPGLQKNTTPQGGRTRKGRTLVLGSGECGQHPCPPKYHRACRKGNVQQEFDEDV